MAKGRTLVRHGRFPNLRRTGGCTTPAPEENDLAQEENTMVPEASTSSGAGSVHKATSTSRLTVTRSERPSNEYSNNAEYLYGAFWHLFPLHAGLPVTPSGQTGPLSTHARRHMLTQFHNVFASNHNFIFLLANQTQRAAAARGVVLRVKNSPENFADFEAMVADKDNFLEQLEAAKKTPTAKTSHDLLKKVLPFLTSCGKAVPWSGEERTSELSKMYALWRCFGVPPCFLTVAPDDVHQPSSIRPVN